MEWTKVCSVCFYLLHARITGKLHQAVFMWCWGSNSRFYECQVPIELHAPDTILILSNRWWLNNSKYIQAIWCGAAIKEKWIQNNLPDTVLLGKTPMEHGDRSSHHSLKTGQRCMYGHYATPISGNPDDHHKGGRDEQRHKQVPSWPCYYMAKWRAQNQKKWWLGLCTSLLNRPGS